ncbi:PhzF family phenazine biosynthesis protein [Amnibacterium endophyticum]|uniref:PhzF family phenazine biosynthesis protein n=1 Tax=Amnibacterium endophyticum TaxID=2109337 RepID=A0ABW4LEP3_9MICO
MTRYPFRQVDVFPGSVLGGNPVAVVLDAEGLDEGAMRRLARWTNLSETTFVLPPTGDADYRLRIFTPAEELPFAGHPTLGSAHAWAEHTGSTAEALVQECAAGRIDLRRREGGWALAAPPLVRGGPASDGEAAVAAGALRIPRDAVLDAEWVDNGPGWLAVRLDSAAAVLALEPDLAAMPFPIGVVGRHADDGPADHEVRAFVPGLGVPEDPVTGSLNAGIATWFFRTGLAAGSYTVRQGTALGADGRVLASDDGSSAWIAGATRTVVAGEVDL